MAPRRPLLLAALALLAVVLSARAAPADVRSARDVAAALARRLDRAGIPAGRVGVAVLTRGQRPEVVFARGQAEALVPASTAKVLTAAAGLDLLGPCHVFTTRLTARGPIGSDGSLAGDLVLHGTGDPNLSGRFHGGDPLAVLRGFARAARDAGIVRVEGALVLEDGPFDREGVHPSWSESDRGRWYGAPCSGLAFNDGCVDLVVEGTTAGEAARLHAPSTVGPWRLKNEVRTVADGEPRVGAAFTREGTLRVWGDLGARRRYEFSHPVEDPLAFVGGAFLRVLAEEGVEVAGGMRPAGDGEDRRPGATLLGQFGSSLEETLRVMNRRSQNLYAGQVFKAAGAALTGRGTWASGEAAVTEMLRRRGLADGKTRIVDGSGLSLENKTTAATLARVLVAFEADLLRGPLLLDSLAVPGGDGTLDDRLPSLGPRLRAKTGTLGRSGVHALCGYLDGDAGEPGYAFAVLLNTSKGGRGLIDDLVLALAGR